MCLTGTVLDTLPVLVGVNGSECGMMTLRGNLIMTKGRTIGDIAQTLQGVTEVSYRVVRHVLVSTVILAFVGAMHLVDNKSILAAACCITRKTTNIIYSVPPPKVS